MLKCNITHLMIDNEIKSVFELMKITGLSRETVNKLFKIKDIETIKFQSIMRICNALHCSLADLIQYIPDNIDN